MSPGQGGLVCDLKLMIRPMGLSADMLLFCNSYCLRKVSFDRVVSTSSTPESPHTIPPALFNSNSNPFNTNSYDGTWVCTTS